MKAGIITFANAHNYGALLQAYASQKYLEKLGVEAHVINFRPDAIDDVYRLYKAKPTKSKIRKYFRKAKAYINTHTKNKWKIERHENFETFINSTLNVTEAYKTHKALKKAELDYDILFAGSDQIWNTDLTKGFEPAYFLDFGKKEAVRVAYAASLGREDIDREYEKEYRKYLKNFNYISVREKRMVSVFQPLTKKEVVVTVDPTLLIDKEDYDNLKLESKYQNEEYIYVHFIGKDEKVIEIAEEMSKKTGLPVLHNWPERIFEKELDWHYCERPEQIISVVENAKMVVSNSFHLTVLSIIYHKSFITIPHKKRPERMVNLLQMVDLEKHLVEDIRIMPEEEELIIDWNHVDARIEQNRKQSELFVEKVLRDAIFRTRTPYKIPSFDDKLQCPTNITYGECYGCYVCKDVCPKEAIVMYEDSEGFSYPVVNEDKCINCGLCEKICIRNKANHIEFEANYPKVLSAMNKDLDTRLGSSSGAVFPALAKHFIETLNGAVVGVKWNENMVAVADVAETMDEVKAFYGSKYVKSDYDGIKVRVKKLLDEGRYVLYSGLPCECSSLKAYLKKDYEKLLICEILCHSSTSPKVLSKYVGYLEEKYKSKVVNIVFRDKRKGWMRSTMVISFANGKVIAVNARRNNYFRAFSKDFICRVSCTKCDFKKLKRVGDITIGDFWGIKDLIPEMFDDKGVSVVLLNTPRGEVFWNDVQEEFVVTPSNVADAFKKNRSRPSPYQVERDRLFERIDDENIDTLLEEYNDLKKK